MIRDDTILDSLIVNGGDAAPNGDATYDTGTDLTYDTRTEAPVELSSATDIDAVAQVVFDFINGQGRASKKEIRAYCQAAGVPTPLYQKAFERLDRQFNIITEVMGADGTKSWAIKDWAKSMDLVGKHLSLRDLMAMALEMKGESKTRETFGDFYSATGIFILEGACLSSRPDVSDPSLRCFLRDRHGRVLLLSGYYEAMFKKTAALADAPPIGTARYKVQWLQQTVDPDFIEMEPRPVPPARPGGSGQGVTMVESLQPGIQIPFKALVPGSHIAPEIFEELLVIAGLYVGFSPSAAHKGWGRFSVRVDSAA